MAEAAAERKPSARELEAALAAAQERLEGLLESLSIADADAAEGRARRILRGLGFSSRQIDSPVSLLSGDTLAASLPHEVDALTVGTAAHSSFMVSSC